MSMHAVAEQVRRRLVIHALMILGLWPLASLLMAAVEIRELPYYAVSPAQALLGAAAGVAILAPDFLAVGLLALAVSSGCFGALAALGLLPATSRRALAAEPVVLFLAAYFGLAACYPAVLAHPVLTFARTLPVLPVTAGLGCVVAASAIACAGGWRGMVVAAVTLAIGIALPQPVAHRRAGAASGPGRAPLVVLGLDSLSHDDDLGALRQLGEHHGGTWYTHAVSPGLLTNAVWTSILLERPVREHGIFHTFQSFPAAADTLVSRARAAGLRSVSVFPDQITCAVGSQAGFDEDRSGPVGWRQLATQLVGNASLLLPVVRPMLPLRGLSAVPSNHAGTFTYDVDRELDGILGEGELGGRALVVAHLTYLHHPRYPSYPELTPGERRRVWWAPAGDVRDRSFDWQDQHLRSDALELRSWKVRRLTTAVAAAVARTGFLTLERGGQLVVLSDHGDRAGLTPNTFWKPEYHHVPLLTIGLPARPDPDAPVSLLDVANLVGLAPGEPPHDPAVEFTVSAPGQWPRLVRSVELGWDGAVSLDPTLLGQIFRGLRLHRPWPEQHPAQVYLVFAPAPPTS
jgi:hypothetical protein